MLNEELFKIFQKDFQKRNYSTIVTNGYEKKLNNYKKQMFRDVIFRAKTPGSWGHEYHLLILCTLLFKNIYIYSSFKKMVIISLTIIFL